MLAFGWLDFHGFIVPQTSEVSQPIEGIAAYSDATFERMGGTGGLNRIAMRPTNSELLTTSKWPVSDFSKIQYHF